MATKSIDWNDGSGDKIYLTYPSASGDQTVQVTSDANRGAARATTVYFSTGEIHRQLIVEQEAGEIIPTRPCLTFKSSGSNTLAMTCNGTAAPVLYYSTDGTTWTLWDYSALTVSAGHPVFIYGSNTSGFNTSDSNYAYFVMGGTGSMTCTGSIATLINGTDTLTTIPNTYCFYYLFRDCTALTSAPTLPSTTLKNYCYYNMFRGCSALVAAPVLPATTMTTQCYRNMFYGCSSLTSAPELKAMTVNASSYRGMFYNCTSLVTAPDLPATTLNTYCYYQMFYGCSSLTSAPAKLPATALQTYCYGEMFRGCSQLTTAPELPATTLTSNCYYRMFYSCSKLTYIKAMFTTAPSTSYTNNWVYHVASSGTFVKNSSAGWSVTGVSGVPSGWTIQTAAA